MLELQPHYLLVTALGSWLAVTSSRAVADRARNSSQKVREEATKAAFLVMHLKHYSDLEPVPTISSILETMREAS